MRGAVDLFSISRMEQGRVPDSRIDWVRDLSAFRDLEETVSVSLRSVDFAGKTGASGSLQAPPVSRLSKIGRKERPLLDETLLQKLIAYRNQIPPSSRIIRANEP